MSAKTCTYVIHVQHAIFVIIKHVKMPEIQFTVQPDHAGWCQYMSLGKGRQAGIINDHLSCVVMHLGPLLGRNTLFFALKK